MEEEEDRGQNKNFRQKSNFANFFFNWEDQKLISQLIACLIKNSKNFKNVFQPNFAVFAIIF